MTIEDKYEALNDMEELKKVLAMQQKEHETSKSQLSSSRVIKDLMPQVEEPAAAAMDAFPPTPSTMYEALSGPHDRERTVARTQGKDGQEAQGRTVKSREADGTIKYRPRLGAEGFSERSGIDFFETFAPTVSLKSLFALIHIAASNDIELRAIDIGAYLVAELDTELHIELPKEGLLPLKVVKLLQFIYGLKQAGKLWNKLLHKHLTVMGFRRTITDPCIYVRNRNRITMYIATESAVQAGLRKPICVCA